MINFSFLSFKFFTCYNFSYNKVGVFLYFFLFFGGFLKNMLTISDIWLTKFKQHIRYFYDNIDEYLKDVLETSALNILTQFMNIENTEEELVNAFSVYENDVRFKDACFHYAANLYENPDEDKTSSNSVIDSEQIYRALGGLVVHFGGYPKNEK